MNKLIYFLLVFALIQSCTIQKRTVNKGYFVQWHFQKKSVQKTNPELEKNVAEFSLQDEEETKESSEVMEIHGPTAEIQEHLENESQAENASSSVPMDKVADKEFEKTETDQPDTAKVRPEKKQKTQKPARKIFSDLALMYLVMGVLFLILGLLFLLLSLNAGIIANTIFAIIGAIFFVLMVVCFVVSLMVYLWS